MSRKTIPCKWCEEPTTFLETKECNYCWEICIRAEHRPVIAMVIATTILDAHCDAQENPLLAYNKVDEMLRRIR